MGLFTAIIFALAAGLLLAWGVAVAAFVFNQRKDAVLAIIDSRSAKYSYDYIGNCRTNIFNDSVTNHFSVKNLNQYLTQLRLSATPRETTFSYDAGGNLLSDGIFTYSYDSVNRLKTILSNGIQAVENFYDAKSRRVRKVTSSATHTFFYDDRNLIEERIAYENGGASTIKYYWGKDLSGTMQGAGGMAGPYLQDGEDWQSFSYKNKGYAPTDWPEGPGVRVPYTDIGYRVGWTWDFLFEAVCGGGPDKGKILSSVRKFYHARGHVNGEKFPKGDFTDPPAGWPDLTVIDFLPW